MSAKQNDEETGETNDSTQNSGGLSPAWSAQDDPETLKQELQALFKAIRRTEKPKRHLQDLTPFIEQALGVLKEIPLPTGKARIPPRLDPIVDYVVRMIVPHTVKVLVLSNPVDSSVVAVNDFLQLCMRVIAVCIPLDIVEPTHVLELLFGLSPSKQQPRIQGRGMTRSRPKGTFYQMKGKPDSRYESGKQGFSYTWNPEDYYRGESDEDAPSPTSRRYRRKRDQKPFQIPTDWTFAPGEENKGRAASFFLISNINFFGTIGGYKAIVDRITNMKPQIPIAQLRSLIKPVSQASELFAFSFLEEYVPQLQDAVFGYFLNMNDDLLKSLTKMVYADVLLLLENVMIQVMPQDECLEQIETLCLRIALKFFRSPFLEKRIAGINEIKETIEQAQVKEEYQKKKASLSKVLSDLVGVSEPAPRCISMWVTTDWLLDWILDNKVIEDCFGENTHIELIRRGPALVNLLLDKDALELQHLDMMWSLARGGQHESIEHLVYNIAAEISSMLKVEHLDYSFEQISQKPYAEYDTQLLEMIKVFTLNAYARRQEKEQEKSPRAAGGSPRAMEPEPEQWYGLTLFWKIVQESNSAGGGAKKGKDWIVPPGIGEQALDNFLLLLGSEYALPQRPHFMGRCVENLKSGSNVIQSLTLLSQIFQQYPQSGKGWFEKSPDLSKMWGIIEDQEQKFGLLDLVLNDLQRYKQQVFKHTKKIDHMLSPMEINNMKIGDSADGYFRQIEIRLDFLFFIISNSSLSLKRDQLSILWDLVVHNKLSTDESDACFKWLTSGSTPPGKSSSDVDFVSLDDRDVKFLFETKMLYLDPKHLTETAYNCVKQSFLRVNEKLNAISIEIPDRYKKEYKKNGELSVEWIYLHDQQQLNGLSFIWEILLQCVNSKVGECTILLLNALHQNFGNKIKPKIAQYIRDLYLKQCLTHLSDGLKNDGNGESANSRLIVKRCVYLLKEFLHGFIEKRKESTDNMLEIIPDKEFKHPSFQVSLPPNDSIAKLRSHIYSLLHSVNPGVTEDCLNLTWKKKALPSTGNAKIREFQFNHGDRVYVRRKNNSYCRVPVRKFRIKQPIPLVYEYPVGILTQKTPKEKEEKAYMDNPLAKLASDQDSFERLFSLLSPESPIGEEVWDILMLLPVNIRFKQKFQTLEDASYGNWPSLFDQRSLYKLLYSLQIIDSIMLNNSEPETVPKHVERIDYQSRRSEWCHEFVHYGGVQFLTKLVTNEKLLAYREEDHGPKRIHDMCLALLFKVINNFLATDNGYKVFQSDMEGVALPENVLVPYLITDMDKLVESILEATTQYILTDGPRKPRFQRAMSMLSIDNRDDQSRAVIIHGLRLLVGCTQTRPELVIHLTNYHRLGEWIQFVCLQNKFEDARLEAAKALHRVCYLSVPPRASSDLDAKVEEKEEKRQWLDCPDLTGFFLVELEAILMNETLTKGFEDAHGFYGQSSEEFFYLLVQLIDNVCDASAEQKYDDLKPFVKKLAVDLVLILDQHETSETYNAPKPDHLLIGILRVLRVLVHHQVIGPAESDDGFESINSLCQTVYHRCLFDIPSGRAHDEGAKCKSIKSRQVAFSLLQELASKYTDCHQLLLNIVLDDDMWGKLPRNKSWNYHPSQMEKYPMRYVGLKNQGATCYMNSLIQQLYMVPSFRKTVLSARPKQKHSIDKDSPLYQMQVLFGYLEISQKKYYDTIPFCGSFKDMDGNSINVNEQKDVNEFFNFLFDQLETQLKDTQQESMLRESFGGVLVNQMISQEGCGHTSERDEPFYMVTVNVKNKPNLLQSLDLYVEGDVLDAENKYLCAGCHQKVKALKRVCFKELPKFLVIHLKRFEFDFDAMKKIKINDHFDFPLEFSVEPYTKEGLARLEQNKKNLLEQQIPGPPARSSSLSRSSSIPLDYSEQKLPPLYRQKSHEDDYYNYKLVGILVHTGLADAGHYYSFIRDQDGDGTTWSEFNDTNVTSFDSDRIGETCFGGTEVYDQYDIKTEKYVRKKSEKLFNAYMLFYQRIGDEPPERHKLASATPPEQKQTEPPTNVKEDDLNPDEVDSTVEAEDLDTQIDTEFKSDRHSEVLQNGSDHHDVADEKSDLIGTEINGTQNDAYLDEKSGIGQELSGTADRANGTVNYEDESPQPSTSTPSNSVEITEKPPKSSLSVAPDPTRNSDSDFRTSRRRNSQSTLDQAKFKNLPESIRKKIWEENLDFLCDKNVYDFNYFTFLWNLVHINDTSSDAIANDSGEDEHKQRDDIALKIINIAVLFTFEILLRAKDNASFVQWLDFINKMFIKHRHGRLWFLEKVATNSRWTKTILFVCPHSSARNAFVDLILTCLFCQREEEISSYFEYEPDNSNGVSSSSAQQLRDEISEPSSQTPKRRSHSRSSSLDGHVPQRPKSSNIRLISALLDYLPDVKIYYKTYTEYFLLLKGVACLGSIEREYLIRRGVISALIDFYMDDKPLKHFNVRTVVGWGSSDEPRQQKIHPPNASNAISCIAILMRSCTTNTYPVPDSEHLEPSGRMAGPTCKLTQKDKQYLFGGVDPQVRQAAHHPHRPKFVHYILSDPSHTVAALQIIAYWAWMNEQASEAFINMALESLHNEIGTTTQQFRTHFRLLETMFTIKDEFQKSRIHLGLRQLKLIIDKVMVSREPGDEKFLVYAIKYLLKMSVQDPMVRQGMLNIRDVWSVWFEKYQRVRTPHPSYGAHHGHQW